ncbi:hypothetical protein TraAM80_06932 [Trypanosoma rangeli]|uniref:SET domain-containing protein n=1 Tax=Trypanosoma rangeli TaxID=5698 RepID=A0A422N815_TRYRA|nr:uncharacterized protein TraAM80_06932 [Trypanosoma rangeli]RNF01618.1 hypothetical protein TraAM80_06932 [Trypanosoma rangeli]|eukprot:RNF01618.1 hypothetical protein TraAM80_06932 [Trypanosoma rangeli]
MNKRRSHRLGRLLHLPKDDDAFLRYLRPLGVGFHPFLRSQQSPTASPFFSLTTSADLGPLFPLAIIPDVAVWTVAALHDDDVEGLMPTQEMCLSLLPPATPNFLCDAFYLSLYFALNAYRQTSRWSVWQQQQMSLTSMNCDYRHCAVEFFRLLSQQSLTPPLNLFLSMTEYTLTHSCRLSRDGTQVQRDGPFFSVIPLVDATLSTDAEEVNLTLERCNAECAHTLQKSSHFLFTRQSQRGDSEKAEFWVLKTAKHVKKGDHLALQHML